MLSKEEIEKLATRKGVKSIAVYNFLGSLEGLSKMDALANLSFALYVLDARLYKWNAATVKAIQDGIKKHFK